MPQTPTQPARSAPAIADVSLLTAIIETQRDIASIQLDPQPVMRLIAERTGALTRADGAAVETLDAGQLVFTAACGNALPYLGHRLPLHQSLSGRALSEGKALLCTDTRTDDRVDQALARRTGVRSMIAVPLTHAGQAVGVLKVLARRPNAFNDRHVATLNLMAGLLAAAIGNAYELDVKRRLLAENAAALTVLRRQELQLRAREIELQERNAVLNSFYDSAPFYMGVVEFFGDDLRHVSANAQSARANGLTPAQMHRKTARELHISDADIALWSYHYRRALREGKPVRFEYEYVPSQKTAARAAVSGSPASPLPAARPRSRWLSATASVAGKGPKGQVRFSYVCEDVTDRHLAEVLTADHSAVLGMIAQSRPLPEILPALVRLVERQIPDATACTWILKEGTIYQIAPGLPPALSALLQSRAVSVTASLCARATAPDPAQPTEPNGSAAGPTSAIPSPTSEFAHPPPSPSPGTPGEGRGEGSAQPAPDNTLSPSAQGTDPSGSAAGPTPSPLAGEGWGEGEASHNIPRAPASPLPSAHSPLPTHSILTTDLSTDPLWSDIAPAALAAGYSRCFAVTARSSTDGDFLGMLLAFVPAPRTPTPAESNALRVAAGTATIAIEHRLATERLEHRVHHDPLTGLPNRMLLDDRLRQALAASRESGNSVALFLLDLDHFKQVNDTLGHRAGDELLQQFASRLSAQLTQTQTLARIGGDEFVLLLPSLLAPTALADATAFARRILASLDTPVPVAGQHYKVRSSIGLALSPAHGHTPEDLLRHADAALYHAKSQGRHCFATPPQEQIDPAHS